MNKAKYLKRLAKDLELLPDNPKSYAANRRLIKTAAMHVGWNLSEPYAQWDYWHCISDTGGVVPFRLEFLIEKLNEQADGEQ